MKLFHIIIFVITVNVLIAPLALCRGGRGGFSGRSGGSRGSSSRGSSRGSGSSGGGWFSGLFGRSSSSSSSSSSSGSSSANTHKSYNTHTSHSNSNGYNNVNSVSLNNKLYNPIIPSAPQLPKTNVNIQNSAPRVGGIKPSAPELPNSKIDSKPIGWNLDAPKGPPPAYPGLGNNPIPHQGAPPAYSPASLPKQPPSYSESLNAPMQPRPPPSYTANAQHVPVSHSAVPPSSNIHTTDTRYVPNSAGYVPNSGGYPTQSGGYPPNTGAYASNAGAYAPHAGAYPPNAPGYGMNPQGPVIYAPNYQPTHGGVSGSDLLTLYAVNSMMSRPSHTYVHHHHVSSGNNYVSSTTTSPNNQPSSTTLLPTINETISTTMINNITNTDTIANSTVIPTLEPVLNNTNISIISTAPLKMYPLLNDTDWLEIVPDSSPIAITDKKNQTLKINNLTKLEDTWFPIGDESVERPVVTLIKSPISETVVHKTSGSSVLHKTLSKYISSIIFIYFAKLLTS